MHGAFCAGWPLFQLLYLASANASVAATADAKRAAAAGRNPVEPIVLRQRFFSAKGLKWDPDSALKWTRAQLRACMEAASSEACLVASRPVWHFLHVAQSSAV